MLVKRVTGVQWVNTTLLIDSQWMPIDRSICLFILWVRATSKCGNNNSTVQNESCDWKSTWAIMSFLAQYIGTTCSIWQELCTQLVRVRKKLYLKSDSVNSINISSHLKWVLVASSCLVSDNGLTLKKCCPLPKPTRWVDGTPTTEVTLVTIW